MHTFLAVLALTLGVIGLIGSVAPGLPGPPLSWVGVFLAFLAKGVNGAGDPISLTFLLIWLAVVIIVSVVDYVFPSWLTKATGGSRYAGWGTVIGMVFGLIYPPVGIFLGALLGAFLFDFFFSDHGVWTSFKSSIGAFLGFLVGTGLKLVVSGVMMYYIVVYI